MTGVRDPAFWRRFSMAVHMDEEKANISDTTSTSSTKSQMKQPDEWIVRNRKKSQKSLTIGCLIALFVLLLIGGLVVVLLWFSRIGPFERPKM